MTLAPWSRRWCRFAGRSNCQSAAHCWQNARGSTYGRCTARPRRLSACRNWLAKHLPAARSVEVTSPASAGQLASERPGAAAVAAIEVGGLLGLGVLAEDIEDGGPHVVRLAIIGRHTPARAHRRRTALVLELHNRPGALADALTVFKREKLDLTRIESLPAAGMDGPCVLFLEVGGSQSGTAFRRAVAAVTKRRCGWMCWGRMRMDYPPSPASRKTKVCWLFRRNPIEKERL